MKYILNRNNFIKESFLNPDGNDEQKVEWEDTLIGSLLNRLYGSSKNAAKAGNINRLANKLDAAIARIFINKTIENEPELKEDINNIANDKALQTVTLITQDLDKIEDLSKEQITILLDGCEESMKQLGANDDITKYLTEFKQLLLNASTEDKPK